MITLFAACVFLVLYSWRGIILIRRLWSENATYADVWEALFMILIWLVIAYLLCEYLMLI